MRIAFASDNAFPWFNGGIEKRRFIIMSKLAETGNEVHCFTMGRQGMPGKDFTYKKIKYHCVGGAEGWQGMYTNSGKRRSIVMPLKFSVKLFFKIMPYKFDMLDADSFPFLHVIPLYLYSKIRRTKFVVTWHEIWSKEFWKHYMSAFGTVGYVIEWICAHSSDMLIANASTTKSLLEHELGVKSNKIVVFPAAIDKKEIERFTSRHTCRKKNKFIVVNRLVKHKRVQLAIQAISNVNAKLVVVGTGPELEMLEDFARKHAEGKVEFKHSLTTDELFEEICESKALIMPSEREGLSLVTLEALAMGTPVVVADTSSLPREVKRMCLEEKEKKLGSLLNRILKSSREYEERARAVRDEVIEEFSGEHAENVYKQIDET
jgi:glycosyltransferase involved in cell wall biosynthesis